VVGLSAAVAADDEVLKERRSPRERGRMGTSGDDAPDPAADADDDGF
jgi:hypothetical protein